MTITDAFRAGKQVKRAEWFNWYEPSQIALTPDDVRANDWMVRETAVELTPERFDELCKRANRVTMHINPDFISPCSFGAPTVEEFILNLREEIFRDAE